MERFHTLQGEGAHTGSSAFFIRLAGCDVGCHWCDVKESWTASPEQLVPLELLVKEALTQPCAFVVVTGGEPCIYELGPLTNALHEAGLRTHIETCGAYPLSGEWHWICFSPKKFKAPLPEYYEKAHELKTVIFNKSDLAWSDAHAERMHAKARVFLQPEWSRREQMLPLMIEAVKKDPHKRISLQTHKYLNIP